MIFLKIKLQPLGSERKVILFPVRAYLCTCYVHRRCCLLRLLFLLALTAFAVQGYF